MKIIDLLNKIANGNEIGTKFKYDNDYFMVGESGQINRYTDSSFRELEYGYDNIGSDYDGLNDEVEIIEEEKEISKITKEEFERLDKRTLLELIVKNQNELIDEIKKLKENI